VIQYDGGLKTVAYYYGRYDKKQVVLLVSLIKSYQGFNHEGNQKYGSGDTSESSLVSSRSKDGLAGHEPLLSKIRNQKLLILV